jgi:hypothetical protein
MRTIRNHRSWHEAEVIAHLQQTGTFTCCTLPHERYQRVQAICGKLHRLGLIAKTGRTPTSLNFAVTPLFRVWQEAVERGDTTVGPVKWVKLRCRSPVGAAPTAPHTTPCEEEDA